MSIEKTLFLDDALTALQNQQITTLTVRAIQKKGQDPKENFKAAQQFLSGHTNIIRCVTALPDGRLVSGSGDQTLKVWDVNTGTCVQILNGHTDFVLCVALLPDGRLVSGSRDNTLKVWDMKTGSCVQTLSEHTNSVLCVVLLPDGRIVSSSCDNTLKVWDMKSRTCVQTLSGHMSFVRCVALLPDGRVVSGSEDNTLKVWDMKSGTCVQTLSEHRNGVCCVALLPDGRMVSGSEDKTLKVWDMKSGTCVQTLNGHLNGHTNDVNCVALLPDGRVVSGSSDNTIKVWKKGWFSNSYDCVQTLSGHADDVTCVALLADGRVVSSSRDHTLKVWDVSTGICLQTLSRGYADIVYCVALLPDGRVVSGSQDKTLKVWDVNTGTCVQTLNEHTSAVFCIALLPNGWLVSGSQDKTLKVWDVKTGTCMQTLSEHTNSVLCVVLLPDGRIVSSSCDKTLKVWEEKKGWFSNSHRYECVQTLSGHMSFVRCVALLPDGRVVSGSWDNTLKVWDVKTGTCVQTLSGHMSAVFCVALLPDGRLVSGSGDQTLKVWDVNIGICLQTLSEHTDSVLCVALLPDGRLVSGAQDKTLKVWDVNTGTCVQTLNGHTNSVFCVALLPDGWLVSGSSDKTLTVWEPEAKILALAPQDQATLLTTIQNNTSLTHLNLSGVALADISQGMNWLKSIVEKHPFLERLDLSETGLTDAMFHKFFPILCTRKCIEELNIEGNPLLSQATHDQVKAYHASLKTPLFPSPPIHTPPDKVAELPKPVTPILQPMSQSQPITITSFQGSQKTPALPFALQKITWESLTLGQKIGSGGYGVVYAGEWLGIPVAIKQLHLETLSPTLSIEFEHESNLMAQCQFPHIVRLYGICDEPGHTAMVIEYMLKGSLYQVLHDEKELFPWNPMRWNIAIDVGRGLIYLHGQKIVHRDLKSLNVLLDQHYHAKIGDFGLSKVKLESSSTSTKTQKGMGTTRWMAPELFKRGASPNFASDVYGYGMILWEIASRQLPYHDAQNDIVAMGWIKDGEKENIPQDCPKLYGAIIEQCWQVAHERPTAQKLTTLLTAAKPDTPAPKPYVEKSWHFDPETKAKRPAPDIIYELVEATEKDKGKVIEFYQHHPVPGYDIALVQVIYNVDMNYKFSLYLKELQQRDNNPAFKPKWPDGKENEKDLSEPKEPDEQIAWRGEIHQQCLTLAKPYQDSDYPAVNLLPMWHGTQKAILDSIFKTGYANLATTDLGYFGKGIYGAHEAEYSYQVYAKPEKALILNWTACFSPYPVMHADMKKLEGKGNYSNYDAHFIPVVPLNPDNPDEDKYYPTRPQQPHTYTELVVFQSAACLPRYLVELQPTLVKPMPSASTGSYPGVFFPSAPEEKKEEKKQPVVQYGGPSMSNE